jgi:hypothetical protein
LFLSVRSKYSPQHPVQYNNLVMMRMMAITMIMMLTMMIVITTTAKIYKLLKDRNSSFEAHTTALIMSAKCCCYSFPLVLSRSEDASALRLLVQRWRAPTWWVKNRKWSA